ncbi:MAG: branched-chain amino acid ABC transporter substrate-binding protein, partial [Betaproteobacteria bacterium]|nr:branched-chain amino acid ABC transporter substrate-binding protein [Betaproteobacteria bacterium]
PASAVYHQCGIPMISGSATNPKLTEQGFNNIFRVVGRDDQQGPAVAQYLKSMNIKKVAIADDATAYGEGLANAVEATLKTEGVQIVAHEKTNDKATDFKAILTKIKGRAPDAVFYGGMDATGGPMLRQARELGIKAIFSFGDGACTDTMPKLGGEKNVEGMICSQAGLPVVAAAKGFLDAYKAKYNVDPIIYAPFTYDAANLLIAAMEKADSTDPAKYLPALQKISYDGATGHIEFDDKGDRKNAEITIFKMTNDKLVPIAVVKGGKSVSFDEFMKTAASAAPAAAPATAPATAPAMAPAEPKK